jgi:cytochrome c peroxidase
LPRSITVSPEKAKLGERLFNDPILSSDNTISCASCHILQLGGTDRQRTSFGVGGKRGAVNAPTVFNTAFNFAHFWDGRAATLEEQAAGPITNPVEMNMAWPEVLAKLQADPEYRADFAKVYPEGITEASVANALASYERTLITPDSPFDRYLRGEHNAIDENARRGYALFKSYGCASCHQGVNVGGNMFQRFGVMGDYFADRGNLTKADLGRYNVTGNPDDRYVFRVPSLRNVAITPPYFHDGSTEQLEEAVAIMARYQLGRELSEEDNRLIVAFLKTLTGNLDGKPLQ